MKTKTRVLCPIALQFFAISSMLEQTAPTITSFTPANGPVGTTVTVTGTGYSTTPTDNVVYFGATKATVSGATATSLTVSVPTGATYMPMSVTVGGKTGYSSQPFVVTFTSGWPSDLVSFDSKVDFGVYYPGGALLMQDLDGDGKSDVIASNVVGNEGPMYRNTSTAGVINSNTFAPPAYLINRWVGDTYYVSADFDGDGKVDFAWTDGSRDAGVRNTRSAGSMSETLQV